MIGLEGVINDKRSQRLLARAYVRVFILFMYAPAVLEGEPVCAVLP